MTFMVGLSPKTKPAARRIFAIVLIILAVIVFLWMLIVNPFLNRQEKNRYEAAYAELESLSKEIQEKIGTAESIETDKSCGYSSAKFSRGHRSCTVRVSLKYPEEGIGAANKFLESISSIKGSRLYPGAGNMEQTMFEDTEDFQQSFSQSFSSHSLTCRLKYEHTDVKKLRSTFTNSTTGFIVYMSCGGPARAEHYPVDE